MIENVWLYQGDCVEVMRQWPDASVDAVVCDPPYEIGFMKRDWDSAGVAFDPATWAEALRVLKPGGHLLAFGGARTFHRMACAIEDAGFEIRDCIMWLYGSGFPKSLNVSKAFDKAAGALTDEGKNMRVDGGVGTASYRPTVDSRFYVPPPPVTEAARQWAGWGTALKPAHEPVILARKPLDGTMAQNVLKWGTGALNIDGSRIKLNPDEIPAIPPSVNDVQRASLTRLANLGRWPANVMLDDDAAALMDAQSEGASRFFYVAKVGKRERDHGLEAFPVKTRAQMTDREEGSAGSNHARAGAGSRDGSRNVHPTVKPVSLMRHLCKLVTPPGGVVLDPFVGSGSTGMAARLEGFKFIGVDQSAEYLTVAYYRIAAALSLP